MHLPGPAAAALIAPPSLPTIRLPADLQSVLEARAQASDGSLFTEDAVLLDPRGPVWIRGREAITRLLQSAQPGARFVPVAMSRTNDGAFVSGTINRDVDGTSRAVRNFHWSLLRVGGQWRIAAESWSEKGPPAGLAGSVDSLVQGMDAAGIRRGVLHGVGYFFASPMMPVPLPDEATRVSLENDWAVRQAARYPDRLVAFCGVNPLKVHSLAEVRRCEKIPGVKGMKLHFANSRVDLKNPEHIKRIRAFFAAANTAKMPIAVHLWNGPSYGREDSELFIRTILPAAPDIAVQVMHLAGAGPSYGPDGALAVFAEAAARRDPAMRNLYFDTAAVSGREPREVLAQIAARLRQIGLEKILFGSDFDGDRGLAPGEAWAAFRKLPLTPEEFDRIAANTAPYMR